jgi:FixJ family two-component response regulator
MTDVSPVIHIVDDDASFWTALGDLLSACGYRVSLSPSSEQLLAAIPNGEPACILLDVLMAGMSGPEPQNRLTELGCRVPVIFITGHGDIPTSVQAIKTGAEDFLTKPVTKETLIEAIERALTRYEHTRKQDALDATLRLAFSRLTPRERQVFGLLARGKPHKKIAFALGTSERTIKLHRHNVMQKFQIQSLAELALIAERLGLLSIAQSAKEWRDPARL